MRPPIARSWLLSSLIFFCGPQLVSATERPFTTLERGYKSIETVRMRARADVTVFKLTPSLAERYEGPLPVQGEATLEMVADGESYLLKSRSEFRLGLLSDMDIAWNGEAFQVLMLGYPELDAASLLVLNDEESQIHPTSIPNILFLPLYFLKQDADTCDECRLRLADIREDRLWSKRRAETALMTVDSGSTGQVTVRLPGRRKGHDVDFIVRMRDSEETGVVESIQEVASSGAPMLEITLSAYQTFSNQGVSGSFPMLATFTQYDHEGDGEPLLRVEITVDELAFNQPVEEGTFTIHQERADVIWHEPSLAYIKAPPPPE